MPVARAIAAAILLALVFAPPGRAQESAARANDPARIAGLEGESTRAPARLLETPLSISVVSREEFLRARPAVDLAEALDLVPGVFAQSSRNFAQDARVSIRGSGARSTFGVRGVKVLVDGIPSTLPDGQSEVDGIDLAFVDRIEVIRGPISSLYGDGGGGLIALTTLEPTAEPRLELRSLYGTDHLQRQEAIGTGRLGDFGYLLGLVYTRYSGYRDHARGQQANLLAKLERELADGTQLRLQLGNVWAPEAQDPGGLTAAQVNADRQDAAPAALLFDAGERLDQQKIGLSVRKPLGPGRELRLAGYYLERDFRNSLPFRTSGRVTFDRSVQGASAVYADRWRGLEWLLGIDADAQSDHRKRYDNANGAYGPLRVDQSENVRSVGPFLQVGRELGAGFGAQAGMRYDWTEFVVGDRIASPADLSDRIHMRQLSPQVGIHFSRSALLFAYANLSTGFQVPTTTELSPASLSGGFDSSLEPERIAGLELGAKGLVGERLLYDVVVFQLRVRDALIPFTDAAGRNLFRNAAEVRRRGLEVGLSALLHPWLSLRVAYTYSDFRYRDYERIDLSSGTLLDFDGEREPNVPVQALGSELRLQHPTGWFAALALRHTSDIEVTDANDLESPAATTSDFRAGYQWRREALVFEPFAGARNWSNVEYNGTLRPNDANRRAFEPAAQAELYAGIGLRFEGSPRAVRP